MAGDGGTRGDRSSSTGSNFCQHLTEIATSITPATNGVPKPTLQPSPVTTFSSSILMSVPAIGSFYPQRRKGPVCRRPQAI